MVTIRRHHKFRPIEEMKIALIILVVLVLGFAIFWFDKGSSVAPTLSELPGSSPTPSGVVTESPLASNTVTPVIDGKSSPAPTPTAGSKTVTIVFQGGAALPSSVDIKAGDTVKFVNNDDTSHWPASGVHPTHQICPGFDSLRGLGKGESYSFQFKEVKTCPWHDHLLPSIKGQIVVGQ
ncbi:MAG: hypothetical protein HY506_00565 [Candidatus Yanofskybacteria bacterium]|nr:hypothetical protein [Candidatus Yanofskybacteria bacterium]